MAIADQIIGVESGGRRNAKNPRSTAYGPGQFLNATWLDMLQRHRPDLVAGRSVADLLALRSDPALSREMTDAYARENQQFLAGRGINPTPGNTYLAHFAGPEGAAKVHANPNQSVETILGQNVVAANPFLRGKTGADLIRWADRKMGGRGRAAPQPGGGRRPASPSPSSSPFDATGMVANMAPTQSERNSTGRNPMFDLSSVLSGLGQGKGYGSAIGKMASAIPSMDSAANPSALDTLFGSLSQFGANPEDESNQGFGDGSNLAAGG